jgi:hypothetical protein
LVITNPPGKPALVPLQSGIDNVVAFRLLNGV